jgi:cyclopropane-fatty-acyl-phospholipid synthase
VIEKIKKLGFSKKVDVRLRDYRDMQGRFDKIISIEMLEAVGIEYYDIFFRQCEKLLAPNGTIGLQVITMPDCRFDEYRRNVDWIQTYIFPGGFLPSLHVLSEAMKNNSKFHIEHLENIGFHYTRTLRIWRERFMKNLEKLPGMGYDATFQRIWMYYLSICEAAFKNRILNDLQIILTRQGNQTI